MKHKQGILLENSRFQSNTQKIVAIRYKTYIGLSKSVFICLIFCFDQDNMHSPHSCTYTSQCQRVITNYEHQVHSSSSNIYKWLQILILKLVQLDKNVSNKRTSVTNSNGNLFVYEVAEGYCPKEVAQTEGALLAHIVNLSLDTL